MFDCTDLEGQILSAHARGVINRADYILLEAMLRDRRHGRLLLQFGDDFEGFTAGALWADLRLAIQTLDRLDRCAIVTDQRWIRAIARAGGPLFPYEVRLFANEELTDALAWLGESSDAVTRRDGVVLVEPRGPIRAQDIAALERELDEHGGELDGVVVHARSFPRWRNVGDFVRHVRFVRDYRDRLPPIAFSVDGTLATTLPRVARRFLDAPVEHFDFAHFDDAVDWVREAPRGDGA